MDIHRLESFHFHNFSVCLFFGLFHDDVFMSFERNFAVTFAGQFPLPDLITSLNMLFAQIFQSI
jgi:hypothetical protein